MKTQTSDNRLKILIATLIVTAIAILAVVGGIIITELTAEDNGDTGERITGDYSISISSGSFSGSGLYSFDGGDNAVESYVNPENGETVTNNYTYIITKDKDGNKYIVFTAVDGANEGKVTTHGFYTGTYTDEFGKKTDFISINETFYYKVEN